MKLPVIAEPKTEAAVQAPPIEKKVNPNDKRGYLFTKRCIDVVGAVAGLLVLLIVFIIIGLLIKLEDPKGSIFFSQKRVGKNGKEFNMYKFRSMVSDAEAKLAELLEQNETTGAMFKMKNDPRVTKIGRFIRKTSIDELPQLINVLKGDMSLVGPRPPLVREVKEYTEYQLQRLLVTPGCTGLWQVSGRSNVGFEEMVKLDLIYITTRSLTADIKIIFRTIFMLFGSKNAY
ncbi:sugar transferase [Priestia aryabhattai]|uniref:sugar transferase n=1 Tax=Priestia aryabhattai TaxID=412384 RepID=UPI001ED30596|nr:sugar transferase [Priestia aryabhattai]MBY0091546.1 sugar transferase [Priestia aryabhattai]MBY0104170.1 sugar transferase [Priestia aryabhattai]